MRGQNVTEEWVKKQITKEIKGRPALRYFMPSASAYGKSGVHDYVICQHGFYWTIEAKRNREKPRDDQIDFANDIRAAGGISLLINEHTLNEVKYVADYIEQFRKLPAGHDFEVYRKPFL